MNKPFNVYKAPEQPKRDWLLPAIFGAAVLLALEAFQLVQLQQCHVQGELLKEALGRMPRRIEVPAQACPCGNQCQCCHCKKVVP